MSSSANPPQTQHAGRIHEHGDRDPSPPRQGPSTLPSDTAAANSILSSVPEQAIENAFKYLQINFPPKVNDTAIQDNLNVARAIVHRALKQAGDSKLKERLRDESAFDTYIKTDGKQQELIKLLGSMARREVLWRNLFDNGTLPLSF